MWDMVVVLVMRYESWYVHGLIVAPSVFVSFWVVFEIV